MPLFFAFPVIVYEDKRINCVTADKSKICICMYFALITNQFRSANAADENIHRALFRSLISFKCNKGLKRRAKLNQQIMPRKTEAMIFVSVCRDPLQSFHDNLLPTRAKSPIFPCRKIKKMRSTYHRKFFTNIFFELRAFHRLNQRSMPRITSRWPSSRRCVPKFNRILFLTEIPNKCDQRIH